MIKIKSISNVMTTPCVYDKSAVSFDILEVILDALEDSVETKDDLNKVLNRVAKIKETIGDNEQRNEFWKRLTSTINSDDLRDFSLQLSSVRNVLIKAYIKGYIALDEKNKIICKGRFKIKELALLTAVALGYVDSNSGACRPSKSLTDGFCDCLYANGKSVRSAYTTLKNCGDITKSERNYDSLLIIRKIIEE